MSERTAQPSYNIHKKNIYSTVHFFSYLWEFVFFQAYLGQHRMADRTTSGTCALKLGQIIAQVAKNSTDQSS